MGCIIALMLHLSLVFHSVPVILYDMVDQFLPKGAVTKVRKAYKIRTLFVSVGGWLKFRMPLDSL